MGKRLFPKAQFLALQTQADVETLAPTRRGDADVTILPVININWWLQIRENAEWGKLAFPGQDFGNAPVGWAVRYGDQEWRTSSTCIRTGSPPMISASATTKST